MTSADGTHSSADDFLSRLIGYSVGNRTQASVDAIGWQSRYFEKMGLNAEYIQPILDEEGHILVASGAGSGKTSALSIKVVSDLTSRALGSSPMNVWLGTFLRSGASDLQEHLETILNDPSVPMSMRYAPITTSTIHSEFYQVACLLTGERLEIIEDWENLKYLRKALDAQGISGINVDDFSTYLNRFENSLGNCPQEYPQLTDRIDGILLDWYTLRRSENKLTHNDIQNYLLSRLEEPDVVDFLSKRYTHIYLDEFQDISRAQYEILKAYLQGNTVCVAVGDDDQTIYSWRGSDHNIIASDFISDFQPTVLELPVNYRCPSDILAPAVRSISKNPHRLPKNLTSYREGGIVTVEYGSIPRLLHKLVEGVDEDLREHQSIAILFRTNYQGILPSLIVASKAGVTFKVSGGLGVSSGTSRAALGAFYLTQPITAVSKQYMSSLFYSLYRLPSTETQGFFDWCLHNQYSVVEGILASSSDDLAHSLGKLMHFSSLIRTSNLSNLSPLDRLYAVVDILLQTAKRDTNRRQQLVALIQQLLTYAQTQGYSSPEVIVDRFEFLWSAVSNARSTQSPKIVLSTVHDFKGKEADSVYVWDDSEGSFPHLRSTSPDEFYEERRIHYIACTRAKHKLTLLGWDQKPSRFIEEMGLTRKQPTTRIPLQGTLR